MHRPLLPRSPLPLLAAALCALCALLALARPASATPARRVYVGVYLHDVTRFDQKDGVFDVDMDLWAKWLGEFDPARIVITNAAQVDRNLTGEEADGAWHSARWRVRGTLRGEFPLQRFPFDDQTLAIALELPERDAELVPDLSGSGMRDRFSVTGWRYEPAFRPRVSRVVYRSDLGSVAGEGRPTAVGRVAFEVTLHRPTVTTAIKFFLPLLVILLVALIALFLPSDRIDARSSIGVTSLLACFAFQFAIAENMPDVSYLTLADTFFLLAYAVTGSFLLVSIASFFVLGKRSDKLALKIDRIARVAVPAVALVILALAARPPAVAAPPAAAPYPRRARPHSARAVLRIANAQIPNVLAAPGVWWASVHQTQEGARVPVLVEQVPSVSNGGLAFLAGGQLEVHWHLRDGLRWSDGTPITADDFAFTSRLSAEAHETAVALSPREFVVRYAEPDADALSEFVPLPEHVLRDAARRGGFEAVREYRRAHPTPGAGPYRVVEYVANERVVLEANPYFVGAPPAIRRIEYLRFGDAAAVARAFEEGRADITFPNSVSPEQLPEVEARRPGTTHVRPADRQTFLQPDLANPLLARRDVRRAILMAIDRERLCREALGPGARVSHVPVPGPTPEGAQLVPYDPAQARTLLASAGAAGARVTLTHGATPVERRTAELIAADLGGAGLVIELRAVPSAGDAFRARDHGGLLLYTWQVDREWPARRYWNLPQVGGHYVATERNDAYNEDVAALAAREERALYPERREQLRDRLFAAYTTQLPLLPLMFGTERVAADPSLRGWDAGHEGPFAASVEEWYFVEGAASGPTSPPGVSAPRARPSP